jgi:predicted  nucleic acid-binding Zn-ribbon protein
MKTNWGKQIEQAEAKIDELRFPVLDSYLTELEELSNLISQLEMDIQEINFQLLQTLERIKAANKAL